jgi:alpha-galactosidase
LPFDANPNGPLLRWLDRLYALTDCVETYEASGRTLMQGVRLNNQFIGTGYSKDIRLLCDFGSSLYLIERLKK